MFTRCPGQDRRFWKPSDVYDAPCPHCGESMEFFRDDITLKCPSCKKPVVNPRFDPGCAAWCKYAVECLGQVAQTYRHQPSAVRDRLEVELRRTLPNEPERVAQGVKACRQAQEILDEAGVDAMVVMAACLLLQAGPAAGSIMERAELPKGVVEEVRLVLEDLESGTPRLPAAVLVARAYALSA
ncbi:MAG: hypothetical protein AB1445_04950 [Bacillota bacterium]